MTKPRSTEALDLTIVIGAPPGRVLDAFFDRDALGAWWQVVQSVTTSNGNRPSSAMKFWEDWAASFAEPS